ncbi:MAG: ABC transporter permease [Myxococcota bacterium]|jgi:phospholipid/cholesterol/gamma-HCH transport system permease protein|nr:ABC transporter permease [Myxococcota bacterium]
MGTVLRFVRALGAYGYFVWDCTRFTLRYGARWERVMLETYRVGIRALPILLTMAVFVGTNVAIQGYTAFSTLGAGNMVGMFVSMAGVREICPLLAGVMVAAKTGTEMAAQLAVMRTREQIDALEVMAVNPYAELVAPNFLAVIIALPLLTLVGLATSLAAAYAVAVYQLGVSPGEYSGYVWSNIGRLDLINALTKSVVYAIVISTVSGFFGFFSEKGPEGVGRATNNAVVTMCIVCICATYLLTAVFYG